MIKVVIQKFSFEYWRAFLRANVYTNCFHWVNRFDESILLLNGEERFFYVLAFFQ